MPRFGRASEQRVVTCHPDIQRVLREAIKHYDFSVLCGHRGEAEQNQAYHDGASKLPWPKSRHNSLPSEAVDLAPYPINWNDRSEFYYLAGLIVGIAAQMGVKLDWGGRWRTLVDLPHFEIRRGE